MQALRLRLTAARTSPWIALFTLACASSPPPEDTTPSPDVDTTSETTDEPELSPEAAALIAETSGEEDPSPAKTPPPAKKNDEATPGKGLDLIYRLKADGLHVEVLGAEFLPKARAVKIAGGWGVEIDVEAQTSEDVSLLGSKKGPLAFAARVTRPAEETIGDSRDGSEDVWLRPEKPLRFRRTWPDAGTPPVRAGQTLELQVGLWGLGATPDERKPVRKFFVVKMKPDEKGATALVSPPQ